MAYNEGIMYQPRPSCKTCGSLSHYIGLPSGIRYCNNCGNKFDQEPVRNDTPDPLDDDVRKKARKQQDALRKAAKEEQARQDRQNRRKGQQAATSKA
jgi:ribosomal protein L37AE/L43A